MLFYTNGWPVLRSSPGLGRWGQNWGISNMLRSSTCCTLTCRNCASHRWRRRLRTWRRWAWRATTTPCSAPRWTARPTCLNFRLTMTSGMRRRHGQTSCVARYPPRPGGLIRRAEWKRCSRHRVFGNGSLKERRTLMRKSVAVLSYEGILMVMSVWVHLLENEGIGDACLLHTCHPAIPDAEGRKALVPYVP